MKKYIKPEIKVEKIELTDLMAASSLDFTGDGTPGMGSDKNGTDGPGNSAEGYSKGTNIWDAWD